MKKNHLFSAVFFLFLLLLASITRAQTVSSQKGLTTAVFNLQQGRIKVYLPDDIRPGDMISGRVVAEPDGKNAKQIEKNLATLKKYGISFNGEKFPVDNAGKPFQFLAQTGSPMSGPMRLVNADAVKAAEINIPTTPGKDQQPAPGECNIPSHALTGSPLRVTGPFDGNSSNTKCRLDNKPIEVLAESPRQCIVSYPAEAGGPHTLSQQENGKPPCTKQVSGVDLNVAAGKLNLLRGEKTYIDVSITGLQNLPDTALLTVTNASTNIITMTDGNSILVPITTPSDSSKGTYTRRFNIQSIQSGSFSVNVDLNLPESGAPPTTTRVTKKCDCNCITKIEKNISAGNKAYYTANVTGGCSGMCGTGTITFTVCVTTVIKYAWAIKGDKNAAEIVGSVNEKTVAVREKNKDSAYTVELTATVECDCNGSCKSSDAIFHPGTKGGSTVKDPTPPIKKDSIPPIKKDPVPPGKPFFPPVEPPPGKDSLPPRIDSLPPKKDSIPPNICECKECRIADGSGIQVYLDEGDIDPFRGDSIPWSNNKIMIAAPVIYSDCPENCKPTSTVEIRTTMTYADNRYPATKTGWRLWPKFGREPVPKILYKGEMLIETRYKCFCDGKLCGEGMISRKIYFIETNKCCEIIRSKNNGQLKFSLKEGGNVTVSGNTFTVNIPPNKPEPFNFNFNIEAIFCNLDDNRVISQFTQIMSDESFDITHIGMDQPVDVPGVTTPYYGLSFHKQANGKEITVFISVYKYSCVYDISVFYGDKVYEYAGPPFLKPADILRLSFNMGDANKPIFWINALNIIAHLARVYDYGQEAAYAEAISNYMNMLSFGANYHLNRAAYPPFKQKCQQLVDAINEYRQHPSHAALGKVIEKLIPVSNVINK